MQVDSEVAWSETPVWRNLQPEEQRYVEKGLWMANRSSRTVGHRLDDRFPVLVSRIGITEDFGAA